MFTQILSSIWMAFASLTSNKMRAMLTMLGIIIGVGSVITLTAIGQGASKAVSDRINSMGTNMIQIDPAPTNIGGISSGAGGSSHITEKDADALKQSPSAQGSCSLGRCTRAGYRERSKLVNKNRRYDSELPCDS